MTFAGRLIEILVKKSIVQGSKKPKHRNWHETQMNDYAIELSVPTSHRWLLAAICTLQTMKERHKYRNYLKGHYSLQQEYKPHLPPINANIH